jgi:taurine dioxygenase
MAGGTQIEVKPIASALGAVIHGVDLSKPLDEPTWQAVHAAFLAHLVVFFPDQHLTREQQCDFAGRFGEINIHPYVAGMADKREVLEIRKQPGDEANFGGAWHADLTFLERPPLGAALYAMEVPEVGGDTLWSNLCLAYDQLSEGMQEMLGRLVGMHSAVMLYGSAKVGGGTAFSGKMSMDIDQRDEAAAEVAHPVIRTHPETGRKILAISPGYLRRFEKMSEAESAPLLDWLKAHATREEFTCRFHWEKNTLALWDNRCTLHYALNDYPGKTRRMHRVAINGDRPR